jgi:CheY-like chemotaxis protein
MLKAGDGTEALEVAWVERSNLIISDILMPTTDGYECVRQLRAAQHRQYRYHFLYSYLAPTRRASHSSGVRCVASSGQNLAIRLILCGQSR